MPKKLTTEQFIEKAILVHGNRYDYSKVVYITTQSKITIVCKLHGEFLQSPSNHLNKNGCPICQGKTTEEFIVDAKIIHGDKYDYSELVYTNNHNYVCIICPKHGMFKQKAYSHLQKHGCKKCYNENRVKPNDKFVNECIKKHGNRYDYSKTKYIHSNKKIEIICKTHGSFFQTPYSHSTKTGCPKCYSDKHKLTQEDFIKKCIETHGDKYDYTNTFYIHSKKKVKIICKIHGEFVQYPFGHMNGQGCKKCTSNISNKEIDFLNHLNIKNENRQIRILNFLVDGYDPSTKTVYEFLGDFWHGNPKTHNHSTINNVTKKTYGELYDFTFNYKFKKLKENGYNVCYMWESDWDNKNLNLSFYDV